MRKCIVILLFCSAGVQAESLASRSKKFLIASFAAVTAAEAAELANRASGIAVGKLGTATVTFAELEASFRPQ